MSDTLLVVLDLVLVVVAARCGGALAVRAGEPRIAGEMIGAILVGPTVLGGQVEGVVDGAVAGGIAGALFPVAGVNVLAAVGAVGMMLYMLLVGMTIDPAPMARRAGTMLFLAAAIVASACAVAAGAAAWLGAGAGWRGPDATGVTFLLALSAAIAAQGVPIAARILEERGLMATEIGGIVVAVGACVTTVALMISAAAIRGADPATVAELGLIVALAAIVVAVAAPLARGHRMRLRPRVAVAALLAIALGAGLGGKALLGTVLIGPLVVGIAVRGAGFSAAFLEARLGALVRGVLLPVFLGVAALHVNLRELLHANAAGQALVLIVAVVVVKTLAGVASARAARFAPGEARAVGALLQCGGVMTLAISLDLLHAGIFTTRTHALMTLVGLVTTLMAGPLLARAKLRAPAGATTLGPLLPQAAPGSSAGRSRVSRR